jgi:hypothetical protein
METTILRVGDINRLRRRAQRAASQPSSLPEGWSISPVDPMGVLAVFSTLRIKPGFTLRAYQFIDGGNGNGVVWAMPSNAPFPPPDACPRVEGAFLRPPKPADALDDAMQAISGDGSPFSYLSASVLARELGEFGAQWHGISWGRQRIIDRTPPNRLSGSTMWPEPGASGSRWTWREPVSREWRPQIDHTGDGVTVRFHVFDDVGIESISRVTDSFRAGSYAFTTESQELAVGGAGIIF